ncbi:MerR family transcriptional regulator [Streptomyces roseoverticillatus]|uniref:DNA polymerase III subunit beta family protein n=1 Tax=Streptomyces roseoverticillatus TaxID=66429 RepID=UPI001F383BFF|nr:MerR family transcriptional regulator [Streptomyces roseoverticillatus]MCF3105799.1 MerR family transcriptional regulator [Streptomyces roseoverticillatus]
MDETDEIDALMSIGAFSRRVRLAPSALRFYDDCDVLRPAYVDDATGYRYYAADQEPRAVLVRRLREAGMPLTDASVVLDGTREEARAVLEGHARRARETAASARSAIEEILRDLPGGARLASVRLGGAELASAVRQVAPAVASAPVREEFPVLGCVLIELDGQETRLVATDRYRLAVRALRSSSTEAVGGVVGDPYRVLIDAAELKEAASWALRMPDIRIEADQQGVRLHSDMAVRDLPTVDGTFPDYRLILDNLPAARHRIITDRTALREAIADAGHDGPLTLHTGEQQLTLATRGSVTAMPPALCTGPPVRIAFDPHVLLPALDAGVGPDVLLEISSPSQPVIVRSADQGSFTTLVMPVRDASADGAG